MVSKTWAMRTEEADRVVKDIMGLAGAIIHRNIRLRDVPHMIFTLSLRLLNCYV